MALVENPAIEQLYVKFNKQENTNVKFSSDDERMIISGPALIADTPVYRNVKGKEFYVFMSAQTIEDIAVKFFKKGYANNLNEKNETPLKGLTIFESFISDKQRGIMPMKGFEHIENPCWFISAKADSPESWAKAKEFNGFSIDGDMGLQYFDTIGGVTNQKFSNQEAIDLIDEFLNDI